MALRHVQNLRHFGFCDLTAIHPNHCQAFFMHCEHEFKTFLVSQTKKSLQNHDYEFHRRIIIIEDENLIQRRAFGFRAAVQGHTEIALIFGSVCCHGPMRRHNVHPLIAGLQNLCLNPYIKLYTLMERASLPSSIKILGLDADDTLWQNEEFFRLTQDRFADMLSAYMPPDPLHEELLAAERRNLGRYGYGIKGFVLSMVETAIDVSKGQVPAHVIHDILVMGRDMLNHPIHLLPGVAECLPKLAEDYALVLVTKGDLLHQEQKLAQSGLGDLFDDVHIVSEKQITTYQRIFGAQLPATAMIGNSIKSDILPALAAGAAAIHIPGRYEWEMEKASAPPDGPRFFKASSFNKVSALLSEI